MKLITLFLILALCVSIGGSLYMLKLINEESMDFLDDNNDYEILYISAYEYPYADYPYKPQEDSK